jgi:transcriptional regulator with XRE-family HTH domain
MSHATYGELKPTGSVLGVRIRAARLRAGLTLRELGQMLHPTVHHSTITNWERGRRVPRQAFIAQLADLFNWGSNEVQALAAERHLTNSRTGHCSVRMETLLSRLREAYHEAFADGQMTAYSESRKQLQLLRKQLASERDRVERQRELLLQLERNAEMRLGGG